MYGSTARAVLGGGRSGIESVYFDGTNDYLYTISGMTGIADGDTGTLSFWFKPATDGSSSTLLQADASGTATLSVQIQNLTGNNRVTIDARDSGGTNRLELQTSAFIDYSGAWYHFMASWDVQNGLTHVYINDASDSDSPYTSATNNIDYTVNSWGIGASAAGSSKYAGDLTELWFNTSYIDLSVEANRRKFIKADSKPAALGATGNLPTGSAPILYVSGGVSDFAANKGTGGGFSLNGTLTSSTSSPSD